MKNTKEEKIKIATTIMSQLGEINRLKSMIDVNKISARESGVQFSFKGSRKANKVVIDLDEGRDLYNITFFIMGKLNKKTLEIPVKKTRKYEGICCDQLIEIFEDYTGLALNLGEY